MIEKSRILLVEDSEWLRKTLAGFLLDLGFEVDEAADGPEALGLAERTQADYFMILTDFEMPGLNGIELIHKLARSRRNAFRFAVLMSGLDESQIRIRSREPLSGDVTFLRKPFSLGSLEGLIQGFLKSPQVQDALS